MNKSEIENKLKELKGKQANHFQKKKADRNLTELVEVRDEMNKLKKEITALNKKK